LSLHEGKNIGLSEGHTIAHYETRAKPFCFAPHTSFRPAEMLGDFLRAINGRKAHVSPWFA
jgi:hypothetical protein